MKETRYFYVPGAAQAVELPADEASHAIRVLRLRPGDEVVLIDGQGTFFRAELTATDHRRCCYRIVESMPQQPLWSGRLHLAVAPTKMMERLEWLAEKATEVGFDELSLLDCQFSERRVVKTDRLERIVVAAMKQSRKAWKPVVGHMQPFAQFIATHNSGRRYIAHCYDEVERSSLFDELCRNAGEGDDVLVLVGPEGDFSLEEVRAAVGAGFTSVHLGPSRLRTETAALSAVMMMQLARQVGRMGIASAG